MKLTSLITILLGAFVITGCTVGIDINNNDSAQPESSMEETSAIEAAVDGNFVVDNQSELLGKISEQLKADEYFEVTKKPMFPLPSDIHEGQIDKYYLLGDVFFALVRRPSMNVPLKYLPENFDAQFAGIIAADTTEKQWEKILTIEDKESTNKNNPYLLWVNRDEMSLTVVDQNGAGSGEGIMKLFVTKDAKNWSQVGCYYFGDKYRGPNEDGDYFQFSAIFEGHTHEESSSKNCNNAYLR